eukprot:TRINITY_DN4935_c0_g1_i1.p1 TRINITY_DN4935_c0_g1~~TRINITY_DN4935_c0_g1_i1.p1  ORF type:complete len:119 (+),score=13.95 TRINITY_DN4935_c0_g1_i1:69-425(+)
MGGIRLAAQTKTQKNTLNPQWNETLKFDDILISEPIKVELFDEDKNQSAQLIGDTSFTLEEHLATEKEMDAEDYEEDAAIVRKKKFSIFTKNPKQRSLSTMKLQSPTLYQKRNRSRSN